MKDNFRILGKEVVLSSSSYGYFNEKIFINYVFELILFRKFLGYYSVLN